MQYKKKYCNIEEHVNNLCVLDLLLINIRDIISSE